MKRYRLNYFAVKGVLSVFFASAILSGCGMKAEEDIPIQAGTQDIQTQDTTQIGTEIYSNDKLSFEINKAWEPMEGNSGIFEVSDKQIVYGLNNISQMGSHTPEELLDNLQKEFRQGAELIKEFEPFQEWESLDGVPCYITSVTAKDNNGVFSRLEFILAPSKNIMASFVGQYADEKEQESVEETLLEIRKSVTFQIGSEDYVTGNTYLLDGGSELCLKEDKSFYYYQSEKNHSQNYYVGTYDVYYGQEAFDYLSNNENYPADLADLEKILSKDMDGYYLKTNLLLKNREQESYPICKDTFYTVVLHNDSVVLSEGEKADGGYDTVYVGYYIPELNIVDMGNPSTGNYYSWSYKDKTSNLDVEPLEEK